MLGKEMLDECVRNLPVRVQLFVPADVAEAIYGIGDAGKAVNKLAAKHNCHLCVKQAFESTPGEEGYLLTKKTADDE